MKKVVALEGDVTCPNFALSDQDTKVLEEEVSVVFHCAATVRFNDPLKYALKVNVKGTREAVQFSLRVRNIVVSMV